MVTSLGIIPATARRLRSRWIARGFLSVVSLSADPKLKIANTESGRRQLAQWLASPENPLTARVTVNRIWHLKRAGAIPYVQDAPNGRVFFERTALDESLRARTATACTFLIETLTMIMRPILGLTGKKEIRKASGVPERRRRGGLRQVDG